jgi:hypothetical protein
MPEKRKLNAAKPMQNQIIPQGWTRKHVARICGGISVRTVERRHSDRLRPAELRNASCREKIYDPTIATRILVRDHVIPKPV